MALIRGGKSQLFLPADAAYLLSLIAPGSPYVEIPEAEHHVMIDQPLAFVAGCALLAAWRGEGGVTGDAHAPNACATLAQSDVGMILRSYWGGREIPQERPPTPYIALELTKALVPALVALGGGLWVAFTYIDSQRRSHEQKDIQAKNDNIARLIEARKPFATLQLQLFMEAGKVAGKLAAFDKSVDNWMDSPEWKSLCERFYQLSWTELSIVEDDDIKTAMVAFSEQLKKAPSDASALNLVAYCLARKIRAGIETTWVLDLGQLSGQTKERAAALAPLPHSSRTVTASDAPLASVTDTRAKPAPSGFQADWRRMSASPTGAPLTNQVNGGAPPSAFKASG